MFVLKAGVREDVKTELEKGVVGGISAIAGFGISEYTSEYIIKAAKVSDAVKKLVLKVATKVGFGLLFLGISWMTGGIVSWILLAAAMGSFGGIALDVMEYFGVVKLGLFEAGYDYVDNEAYTAKDFGVTEGFDTGFVTAGVGSEVSGVEGSNPSGQVAEIWE